ncbi:hypothetical protein PsYK624_017380 [Phanerochaete sordida]|uniref:Coiled-coil domain-containing protein 16 n=1 Tax=Phanerochaete sordida TaxID=48140 RepID=A0A9P3L8M4_9APHY|nr:hypothetical protein PsYK624_017380 [Phanerochaete sordida]
MSDVRALLKAKRQEARVTHPLAAYSASGQLRCTACGTAVKHASSWEGHIGSKAHRVNAARLREEEERRRLAALRLDDAASGEDAQEADEEPAHKRKAADGDAADALESKRRRVEGEQPPPAAQSGFPADFFSDPAQAPAAWEDADAEDGEGGAGAAGAAPAAPAAVDLEWEKFQQEVLNPPDVVEDTFQRATVMAEPTVNEDALAGFPPRDDAAEEPQEELTEEQIRRRKEQDERELIMDRLMEEERAQEEADARVTMLKTRLEALRRQREAKKGAKTKKGA